MKTRPAACDCLNDCGDDPWLKDGRSKPCARLAEIIRRDAVREGIVISLAQFNDAGDQFTVAYASPLTQEQQTMVWEKFVDVISA